MSQSPWMNVMIYGSNELVQLASDDRKLVDYDLVDFIYPIKLDKDQMLRAYYHNLYAVSTSVWRLVSRGTVPWMKTPKPKPLFKDVKTAVPRRLLALAFSDILPLYNKPKAAIWWMKNLFRLPNGGGKKHLADMIGHPSRSCSVQLFIEYDTELDKTGVDFVLKLQAELGYPNDPNVWNAFSTPVYLSNVVGSSLKAKATTLMSAPKHLRRRFSIMNDEDYSLADCVKLAQVVGCRVALHATNFVKYNKGPMNLKHKLVEQAKNTCRSNKGSSPLGFYIVINESIPKRLAKIVPVYAKHGNVVIMSRK